MASFQIYPVSQFETEGRTVFKKPRHILQFSFDANHHVQVGSEESLRYYYPPHFSVPGIPMPSISLSNGVDTWIKSDEAVDGHLDALLATIQAEEEALLEAGTSVDMVKFAAEVITWRGMMTKASETFLL